MTEDDTSKPSGWANYTGCFPPDVNELLNKMYSSTSMLEAQVTL